MSATKSTDGPSAQYEPSNEVHEVQSKKYFFGSQGKSLIFQVSFAGSIGFLLFGYDQGVLGVSHLISVSSLAELLYQPTIFSRA